MNSIKILVCEDLKDDQADIGLYIDELSQNFLDIKFEVIFKDFSNIIDELKYDYDLLILDFYDEQNKILAGERVLKHNRKQIKTVIYTSNAEQNKVDYPELKKQYNFLKGYLSKLKTGDNLKDFITSFIFENKISKKKYTLYNENDIFLNNSIYSVGETQFNEIIHQCINDNLFEGDLIVYRMTSGLSGASLFKLENKGIFSILKISKEIEKLKKEHENAIALYHKFPSRFINHINQKEYYSFDKNILGILIKEVNDSETFFDFLLNSSNDSICIENFLNELCLSTQSLKGHYTLNQSVEKKNWTYIFNKFDNLKFSLIELAVKELNPLLSYYYPDFKISDIKNLVINNCYGDLDKNKLLGKEYQKQLVLCHGDLHAKNILVQSSKIPVIIDTGAISYDYWCKDICRLIANLFILGYDNNTKDFYDIHKVDENIQIVDKIINQEEIHLDSKNDNIITSLNWLIKNCNEMYSDMYSIFEFQLGLMKEFLQIAYRIDTIPPNKRTIALISAYKCMNKADEKIK